MNHVMVSGGVRQAWDTLYYDRSEERWKEGSWVIVRRQQQWAVLRAVKWTRKESLGIVGVAPWLREFWRDDGDQGGTLCVTVEPVAEKAASLDGVVVVLLRWGTLREGALHEEAVRTAVARQLKRLPLHGVDMITAVPLAGVHVVVHVKAIEVGPLSIRFSKGADRVFPPLPQRASLGASILACYQDEMKPRVALMLSWASQESTIQTLLLVSHLSLMPLDLLRLIACQIGVDDPLCLTCEDVVLGRGNSIARGSIVVLSGLEDLSEGDAMRVFRWMETQRERNAFVLIVLVHELDLVPKELVSPAHVGVPLWLHAPDMRQRERFIGAFMGLESNVVQVKTAATMTGGYSIRDLIRFCETWRATSSLEVTSRKVVPLALSAEERFEPRPISWDQVRGSEGIRAALQQSILWPIRNPERLAMMKCSPPSGVLLYGPSGCGKSMCVNAFAREAGINLVQVRATRILSRYTGQTEATVRRIFARARSLAPCMLFFDDLDVLAPSRAKLRAEDTGGSVERLVSTLLNEMDGVDTMGGSAGVYVVACSTRPWALDAAILRPGRLDRLLFVPLPNFEIRIELLEMNGLSHEEASTLSWQMDGMTHATVCALAREAHGRMEIAQALLGKYSMARVPASKAEKFAQFNCTASY